MVVSCSEFKEDISSLIDGELDAHSRGSMLEHLSTCADCHSEHENFKSIGRLMSDQACKAQERAPDIWTAISLKLPGVCECIQEDLSAYLDGELIASAKEGVSSHLEQCEVCLKKFNELSRVNSLLSTGLGLPNNIEVDIWSQVKARLNDDCILIKSELSAFIDKEVATLRHRAITTHLTECVDCKGEFNRLSDAGESIRTYYQPEIPDNFDLWPSLQSKMKVVPMQPREKSRHIASAKRMYVAAAVVVLGILASISAFVTMHSSSPSVQPITAEAYLIDSSLGEPADVAEAVVYDH